MPSKPPGVLGQYDRTSFALAADAGITGHGRSPQPTGLVDSPVSLADMEHRAAVLAHEVATATGWHGTHGAAWRMLGGHSFTAGVVYGLFENFAHSVAGAADMLKTFALAEYWDSRYGGTNAARIRAQIAMATLPVVGPSLAVASALASRFHVTLLEEKAREAHEERGALIEAVRHVFTHPKDFVGKLSGAQAARFAEFERDMAEESLSGSFEAGKLLGELLFDVLMVIDLAAGLAKLALQVPRLARFTEDVARLAGDLRTAKRLERVAKDTELVDPPPKSERGRKAGPGSFRNSGEGSMSSSMRGRGGPESGDDVGSTVSAPRAGAGVDEDVSFGAGAPASDSPVVLAGHGGHIPENGDVTVPTNTTFTVYAEHGATISDPLGNAVERGQIPDGVFSKTYRAGDSLPNYTLYPGPDLTIEAGSTTVARPTLLSDILQPNMGEVHWAACTSADGLPTSSWMYDIDGVIDAAHPNPDYWSWVTVYPR